MWKRDDVRLAKDTGDEVVSYLKSLELKRVRCIVGFVEQSESAGTQG